MDAAAKIPGLLSLRRYLTVEGAPANLLIYEFESLEARRAGALDEAWSTPMAMAVSDSLTHDTHSKVLYERIWHQG